MKKYLILSLILLISACADPSSSDDDQTSVRWKENTHYTVLDQVASPEPTLKEFFSFWCPHCYQYEPLVKQLKAKMSNDISFEKVHVDFMGFTNQQIQQQASIAMIAARHLNREEEVNQAIFSHIHVEQKSLNSTADLNQALLAVDISEADLQSTINQAEVQASIKSHYDIFLQYRGEINSVPSFVVNGKYLLRFNSDMTIDDMVELIEWLAKEK